MSKSRNGFTITGNFVSVEAEPGVISKFDDEQQNFFGWAYVSHNADGTLRIDKSGEAVPEPVELEKAAYEFVVESRTGGDFHVKKGVSTMIESVVFTPEKIEKMGLPAGSVPTGWWVGFHTDDRALFDSVKDGRRKMFSIHGQGLMKKVRVDG